MAEATKCGAISMLIIFTIWVYYTVWILVTPLIDEEHPI